MTMAILAVIAAIAVPRYASSLALCRADRAARRIVADLGFARDRARVASETVTVQFDVPADQLSIPGLGSLDNPSADYLVKFGEAPYQADLVSADFGGDPIVSFDGYGVPDGGGTIVIQAGTVQRTVVLNAETGEASVS
ncbi:MAG: hypothetical protein AMJ81_12440 [Phycisphaerae bacterium SM23_33]|nr:MAG: hypothetical protein AMJ81_12440 [Phycisphaerae bacterium SM23_33]